MKLRYLSLSKLVRKRERMLHPGDNMLHKSQVGDNKWRWLTKEFLT